MGSHWLYLFCWGHVCIWNHSALRRMAQSVGLTELAMISVNHPFGMSPGRWLYWSIRASLASTLRSLGVLQRPEKSPGLVFSYCYDHVVALFQKLK